MLDESSNTGFVDSGSSYKVIGDNETGTFTIEANNVRFHDGAPALSAKVTGLRQYLSADSSYVYMDQKPTNFSEGAFTIRNLRYGMIGNMWLTYDAGGPDEISTRYVVNVVPRRYNAVADTVTVRTISTGRDWMDVTFKSRIAVEFAHDGSSVSFSASGMRFESEGTSVAFVLPQLPVSYTTTGYEVSAEEVIPKSPRGEELMQYRMTSFKAEMSLTYEGKKKMTFRMPDYPGGARYVTIVLYNRNMAD